MTHCAQTFFSPPSLATQVDPTVGVGFGVADVVEVTFEVVDVTLAVVVVIRVTLEVVGVRAGTRQMLRRQDAPQILFASPVHAIEHSESAVLALAAGAEFEHQHSRP